MKKISVTLTLVLACFMAQAQSGIGIKGGINLSNVYTDAGSLKGNIQQSLDTKTGFVFGLYGRVGKKVFLQPELLVASRGGEVEIQPIGGGGPQVVDIKYTNLDVPILIGFQPLSFLRIMAGPVASFKLSEDEKLKDALAAYTTDTGEAIKDANYGYQVGVGVKILGFDLDLRKEGSLSEINMLNLDGNPQFSQRASGWQLTLAKKIL